MTIKELYDWAKIHKCKNAELICDIDVLSYSCIHTVEEKRLINKPEKKELRIKIR